MRSFVGQQECAKKHERRNNMKRYTKKSSEDPVYVLRLVKKAEKSTSKIIKRRVILKNIIESDPTDSSQIGIITLEYFIMK